MAKFNGICVEIWAEKKVHGIPKKEKKHGIPEFQIGSKIVPEREMNQQRRRFQVNPLTTSVMT